MPLPLSVSSLFLVSCVSLANGTGEAKLPLVALPLKSDGRRPLPAGRSERRPLFRNERQKLFMRIGEFLRPFVHQHRLELLKSTFLSISSSTALGETDRRCRVNVLFGIFCIGLVGRRRVRLDVRTGQGRDILVRRFGLILRSRAGEDELLGQG